MTVVAKKQIPKAFSFLKFPLVFLFYVVKQVFLFYTKCLSRIF
jgi:hypothetical protein